MISSFSIKLLLINELLYHLPFAFKQRIKMK
jgi:hypothetical protein